MQIHKVIEDLIKTLRIIHWLLLMKETTTLNLHQRSLRKIVKLNIKQR